MNRESFGSIRIPGSEIDAWVDSFFSSVEELAGRARSLEGSLPTCLRIAVFEGWRAWWHDKRECDHNGESDRKLVFINVAPITQWLFTVDAGLSLPEADLERSVYDEETDDTGTAEAMWLVALEKLRETV